MFPNVEIWGGLMYNTVGDEVEADIRYMDESLVLCVKPAGVSSEDEMPALLRAGCGAREIFCVHRLDTAVGGLMVYAKTKAAAAGLSQAIARGALIKEYLAVSGGAPVDDAGVMRDLLYRDKAKNKSYVVSRPRRGVREAELSYRVLERRGGESLVSVRLGTGRSHQIRVQFASRGMPLLGDVKYGSARRDCRIALWSRRLCFAHPLTGQSVDMSVSPPESEPWTDFMYFKKETDNG